MKVASADVRVAWVALGLVAGLILSPLLGSSLHTPLHATATDRTENFAVATGWVDNDVEAVYFLDYLTGTLRAAVLNTRPGAGFGKFTTVYEHNILLDLGVDIEQNPKFLIVTGGAAFPNAPGGARIGNNVIYVMEITSGKCAAYGVPRVTGTRAAPAVQSAGLVLLDMAAFRGNLVRN